MKERKNMSTQTNTAEKSTQKIGARTLALVGMLSAVAVVLMTFDIPLPFAPTFYKIDFSGTQTAGVGEVANFLIGCAFIVPAGLIYHKKHTRTGALIGMASGTVLMTVIGGLMNAYVLLPVYAKAFGMPLNALVEMGTAINAKITSVSTLILFAVTPFNLLKGVLVSLIVFLIYKKISPIFRMK